MKSDEFNTRVGATRMSVDGLSVKAARRVLVDGESVSAAAKGCEISRAAVWRAVRRLQNLTLCTHCGRAG